jgi:probable HAF family extracellular repeat protein
MRRKSVRAGLIGTTALTVLASMPVSAANFTGGQGQSAFYAVSPDGGWVAGSLNDFGYFAPTFWPANDLTYPESLTAPGAMTGVIDGGGFVGWYEPSGTRQVAFYVAPGAQVAIDLPSLAGNAQANGINANGTIAVGVSDETPVYWDLSSQTIHQLQSVAGQSLAGGSANGASDDGSIIVGQETTIGNNQQAVFWDNLGLAQALPAATGNNSGSALAVSGDGTTAVGYSGTQATLTSPITSQTATRWTLASGGHSTALSLGTLNGDPLSEALAVNHNGSVVVGWSGSAAPDPTNASTLMGASAFRWTALDQMQSVQGLLTAEGVSMTGWNLTAATGTSSDGTLIVGYGSLGATVEGWIARLPLPVSTPLNPSQAFSGLAPLNAGFSTSANGVSRDGNVVVGASFFGAHTNAMEWSTTGSTQLPSLGGNADSSLAVNSDGSVIVGGSNNHAALWQAGAVTDLGTLPSYSVGSGATGVNSDGTVVVGVSTNGIVQHAFRWVGGTMTDLGTLSGDTSSAANGVSDDGSKIAGTSSGSAFHAVLWSGPSFGILDLGTLGGSNSFGNAISGDGTTIVGSYQIANSASHAARWVVDASLNVTSTDLGTLTGAIGSSASAVNHDGSVIVGYSGSQAFRWTAIDNMQSVQGLLTAAGVNMAGWALQNATGVSADGKVIVGNGTNGGNSEGWVARIALPTTGGGGGGTTGGGGGGSPPSGFISFDTLAQSFAGQAAIGQMGNSIIGGDLAAFNQYATQDHGTNPNMPWSVFGYASYNSDPAGSGTVGITRDLPWSMIVGAAVSADFATTSMVYDGKATMQGGSGGIFAARVPDAGLQWFLGVDGAALSGSATRGYLNGSGPASSFGDTNINGYGATARVGWTFNNLFARTQITPFVSYAYTLAHVNGYTESSGPFPAAMDAFDSIQQVSRVGADARYTFMPGAWLWGTAAWAHVINAGNAPTISGQLIGLFSVSVPGFTGAPDWAELTAGVRLPAWHNGAVTASVTASVPTDNEPVTYVARLGLSQAF